MKIFVIGTIMLLYLMIMLIIGLVYSKTSSSSSENYFLGGRKLGPFVTAMSAEASDMSGYLLMGLPGLAYFTGLADVGFTALGLAIGTYLNWLFVAKRLRNYTKHINAITLPEYISYRFHEQNNALKIIAAIFILIFFVVYVASCFVTFGKLFSSIFNANYHIMMIAGALIVLLYTLTGGFLAVCFTDLIQAVIMIFVLIMVAIFGINNAGGINNIIDNISKIPGYLSLSFTANPIIGEDGLQIANKYGEAIPYTALTIVSTMAWGLGYFGMPQVLIRFFAIRDAKEIKMSRRVATIWVVISMATAVFLGFIGRTVFPDVRDLANSSLAENVFIKLSMVYLPWVLCGLSLSGILAAAMSSADSYLLITASSIVQDIYKSIIKKDVTEKIILLLSKVVLVIVTICSIIVAWDDKSIIFKVVSFAWAGFGATFGPLILLSLFWKRTNKMGAICGMIVGGGMVFVWKLLIANLGGIFAIYELLPAFICSFVTIIIVSLCTKEPDENILNEFEEVRKK